MRRNLALVLLSLLLATAAVVWFLQNYERVTREIVSEASEEVLRNPFIAAERFLTANGYEAESSTGRELLQRLPPATDTLVVNNFFTSLADEKEQELLDWIAAGGHLILTPKTSWSEEKLSGYPLLDELGIHRHGFEINLFGLTIEDYSTNDSIRFLVPGVSEPVEAVFDSSLWLHIDADNPDYGIPYRGTQDTQAGIEKPETADGMNDHTGQERYHLIQKRLGNGLVTVTSDNLFMLNEHIGDLDHAWLLWLLTDQNGKVWLLYDKSMPSLWSLLVEHAWPVLVAFAVLVMLLLWHGTRRTGPIITSAETRRRDLIEHLDATSRYHWRNGDRDFISAATRRLVLDFWQRQHSQLSLMDHEQQVAWISRHSGLEPQDIHAALFSEARTHEQLVRQAQTLQLLRLRIYRG